MKIITEYQCEVCSKKYTSEKDAIQCESVGAFNSDKYTPGLMWEYHHHGYIGIFCLPDKVAPYHRDKHLGSSASWACRSPAYNGDSIGKEQCGSNFFKSDNKSFLNWINYHHITKDKVGCDEYNRMVAFLKTQNIQPSYYNEFGELIKL